MSLVPIRWKYLVAMLTFSALLIITLATVASTSAADPDSAPDTSDTIVPTFNLINHGPVTHAVGVDVSTNITASFDQSLDPSTVNDDTWVVHGDFGGVMTGTISVSGQNLAFDPDRSYFTGESISAIATSDINDAGGAQLNSTQFNFTAGPIAQRCNGQFADINAGLIDVQQGSVDWGDYDNDNDLDILLTGIDVSSNYIAKIYRNTNGVFAEQTISSPGLTGVVYSDAAWGDFDNDGDLDIVLSGYYYDGGHVFVGQVYRNLGPGTGAEWQFVESASFPGAPDGSVDWGDYNNDGYLDLLIVGDIPGGYASTVYRNDGPASGSAWIFTDIGAGLTGVRLSDAIWGDVDNDGDLDILLTGEEDGGGIIVELYRNDGPASGSSWTFTKLNVSLPAIKQGTVDWGDYDNDKDLDLLIVGDDDNSSPHIASVYRNDGPSGGTGWSFTDINAGLTGVETSSAEWGDYNNDGRLDILLTGAASGPSKTAVYRNEGPSSGGDWTFVDIEADLTDVYRSSAIWGDYDNDADLDILSIGHASLPRSKIYRNDDCGDLTISKSVSSDVAQPGDPITYTIQFENIGNSDVEGVAITDTLPAEFTLTYTDSVVSGIAKFGQVAGAPNPVWLSSAIPPGGGGTITLGGVIDSSLRGDVTVSNRVTATARSDEPALTNNVASVIVTVREPGTLTVQKTVYGPTPVSGQWSFVGSSQLGAFHLPVAGGSKSFTLPVASYTLSESVRQSYTPSATCTTGDTGRNLIQFTVAPGADVTCMFTNTYNAHTLDVNTVGNGNFTVQPDQSKYIHDEVVTLTAYPAPGWKFSGWSGDASNSVSPRTLVINKSKTVTATFINDSGAVLGTVLDAIGKPIAGVTVTLAPKGVGTAVIRTDISDTDGEYSFNNVSSGDYTLTFSKLGYQTPPPVTVQVASGGSSKVDPVVMLENDIGADGVYLPAVQASK